MDLEAAKKLQILFQKDRTYHEVLNDLLRENDNGRWSWELPVLEKATGLNYAMFTSGLGDSE